MFQKRSSQEIIENKDQAAIELKELLVEIFINNGRLLHHERVLCHFPDYLNM